MTRLKSILMKIAHPQRTADREGEPERPERTASRRREMDHPRSVPICSRPKPGVDSASWMICWPTASRLGTPPG